MSRKTTEFTITLIDGEQHTFPRVEDFDRNELGVTVEHQLHEDVRQIFFVPHHQIKKILITEVFTGFGK